MKEVGPSGSAKPEKYLEFEAEVTVDDDANTINIKTSKPYANLVGQLCHPTMGITDVEHIENYDNGIIGTGPYKIEEFNGVGVGYTLAAEMSIIVKMSHTIKSICCSWEITPQKQWHFRAVR